MNKEIMALEGRELDAAVATAMGDEVFWLYNEPRKRWYEQFASRREPCPSSAPIPSYHSSLDAIRPLVERCVEEIGRPTYRVCLRQACDHTETWIHFASATDHCRAILLCLGDREVARGEAEV
jgi:hypothetical protein